ncbi:flavin-containing monooxygenase FMO GS-OX-like 4 protein, partial [Tanacetum coccineum]
QGNDTLYEKRHIPKKWRVLHMVRMRYKYHFPFLDTEGIVTVNENRVGPLYKHVFPPALAFWLSFVVPFPRFEFQSQWIAGSLSGRISLPSPDEITKDIEAFYLSLLSFGIPKRYTHNMGGIQ